MPACPRASRRLPSGPAGLGAARVLDASANRLEQLPSSLACLAGLASLKLSGNALQRVPWQALAGMSALSSLQLDGNHFAAVPAELGGCTALVALSLASNRISSMDPACLQGLTRLQVHCRQQASRLCWALSVGRRPPWHGACRAGYVRRAFAGTAGMVPPPRPPSACAPRQHRRSCAWRATRSWRSCQPAWAPARPWCRWTRRPARLAACRPPSRPCSSCRPAGWTATGGRQVLRLAAGHVHHAVTELRAVSPLPCLPPPIGWAAAPPPDPRVRCQQ